MLAPIAAQKLEKKRFANLDALSLDPPNLNALSQDGTRTKPLSVLVVFHGYGATAEDLTPLAPSFAEAMPDTAQVFLQAPDPCFVGAQGMEFATGRAWFPLQILSYEEIVSGLRAVEECVAEALEEVGRHYAVPFERIALFGFSQGGMVALQAACNAEVALLATVGVATRFVAAHDLRACASRDGMSTPLMMIHGEEDEVVPFQQGLETETALRDKGYNLVWLARAGMGHAIDEITLKSACDFLSQHARQMQTEQTKAEKVL